MISIEGLSVAFGGNTLFDNITYVINKKDRIALVGKNGAEHILEVPLTSEERRQFKQCAQNLTDILRKIS